MFQIGEFSKLTQVTVRMLRYYDETGLLKPEWIDPWTGYRMYSVNQIPVLNKIVYLRDSGLKVAEIAAALKEQDSCFVVEQLDRKYEEVLRTIRAEQEKLRRIEIAKKGILQQSGEMHYQVSIKEVPSCQVLSLRKIIPDYYAEGELWKELSAFAKEHGIQISDQTFTLYHDSEYKEQDVDVELCAPVRKPGRNIGAFIFRDTEPVPVMASSMVYGSFFNIAGAYRSFAAWLQENSSYKMMWPSRQIVHRGPWNEADQDKYLVEIQIPLEQIATDKLFS